MNRESWHGDEILRKVQRAARAGIDETHAACVNDAKSQHWWQNQTGALEGSLQMRPAVVTPGRVSGQWGSFTVEYAIYLEMRQSFLRVVADREYPKLGARINKHLKVGI